MVLTDGLIGKRERGKVCVVGGGSLQKVARTKPEFRAGHDCIAPEKRQRRKLSEKRPKSPKASHVLFNLPVLLFITVLWLLYPLVVPSLSLSLGLFP